MKRTLHDFFDLNSQGDNITYRRFVLFFGDSMNGKCSFPNCGNIIILQVDDTISMFDDSTLKKKQYLIHLNPMTKLANAYFISTFKILFSINYMAEIFKQLNRNTGKGIYLQFSSNQFLSKRRNGA